MAMRSSLLVLSLSRWADIPWQDIAGTGQRERAFAGQRTTRISGCAGLCPARCLSKGTETPSLSAEK